MCLEILQEDGLLPKGHFMKVSTDELIGQYVGETKPKTRAVCERARGGVLFIDEAYGLMSGSNNHETVDYGKEAIEVLIQFMEDHDDSLVIFAGYTDEIMDLINNGNQGFRRRFNDKLGFFTFKDYSPEVLYNIALSMIKIPTTDAFKIALRNIIRYKWAYKNKKFGNVGDMENIVSLITSHYNTLGTSEPLDIVHLPNDLRKLIDDSALDVNELMNEFNNVIGQESVKELARKLFNKIVADRKKLKIIDDYKPKIPKLNFLFIGNPGTGKTTIARIFGRLLCKLGIFPDSTGEILTEISGSILLQYTPKDIKELFENNIGKVVFIDEAYSLRGNERVIADIVGNLELEEFKNKLSVIMAGYPDEMHQLYSINKGLKRRFEEITFNDYTNEELYEILQRMVSSSNDTIMDADECRDVALQYFQSFTRDREFGNGGVVENLMETLIQNRDLRYLNATPEQQKNMDLAKKILPCDFPINKDHVLQHLASAKASFSSDKTFTGILDCSHEDESKSVNIGDDIYTSVGLIESENTCGTAFIISIKNRYIMTASHVVEGFGEFHFTLNYKNSIKRTTARLLWNNPEIDFAILQVESLPPDAKYFIIDIDTPRSPATKISIIAFPLGKQVSNMAGLTSGAIYNSERGLEVRNENGSIRCFDAIRTEAQATHGSSGGPVILAESMRVIGVLHGGINEHGFYLNIASDILQLFNQNTLNIKMNNNDN